MDFKQHNALLFPFSDSKQQSNEKEKSESGCVGDDVKVDVDGETGIARGAKFDTSIAESKFHLECGTDGEVRNAVSNKSNDGNNDVHLSSSDDLASRQQQEILRTTPGAFAINNPLTFSSPGDRPLLEQRPSLMVVGGNYNFNSRVLGATCEHSSCIPEDGNSISVQDVSDNVEEPTATTAATTPCLSAIRIGHRSEVYEGTIVGDEINNNNDNNKTKQHEKSRLKTKCSVGALLLLVLGVSMALVVALTTNTNNNNNEYQRSGGLGNNSEESNTGATDDNKYKNKSPGTMHGPSGVFIDSSPDPQREQLKDYTIALLAPISGPAGAGVFDRSGRDTSLDRISALNWVVDTLALDADTDDGSYQTPNSISIEIPEWKILQRYVLALLYFTTNGDAWDSQSKFLSKENECLWKEPTPFESRSEDAVLRSVNDIIGVSCNKDDRIHGLHLRK